MATSETEATDKVMEEVDTTEDTADEQPEIEEDLVQEELRIDGICGVY